jgi:heat shock protein HspQ
MASSIGASSFAPARGRHPVSRSLIKARRDKAEKLRYKLCAMPEVNRSAKFQIGQVVKHRLFPFRGVIFDVDPTFSNSEEWWLSIPEELRPRKDQPYYHLLAENAENSYIAYVSEQNLLRDETGEPVSHPQVRELFGDLEDGCYRPRGDRKAH